MQSPVSYDVLMERYKGELPHHVDQTLEDDVLLTLSEEEALNAVREWMASAGPPVLHPDGIEESSANIKAIYYEDEDGNPLPPMTVEEYEALESEGDAFINYDRSCPRQCLLRKTSRRRWCASLRRATRLRGCSRPIHDPRRAASPGGSRGLHPRFSRTSQRQREQRNGDAEHRSSAPAPRR